MQRPQSDAKLPRATLPLLLTELLIIIVASVMATSVYADFDPKKRLGGAETEYLTRTAYSLSVLLPQKGYFPLWQPYMELGDPMLENPVSFAFNPFLTWPSIFLGPYNGIKFSTILAAVIAGLGGWALGRVLGFGTLARVLLGLLCVGKGNMHSYISQGHFALFVSQSYFPWLFAGVIAGFRGYKRWPIVLASLSFALIFWTGIPWYPPAIVIAIGFLLLPFLVEVRTTTTSLAVGAAGAQNSATENSPDSTVQTTLTQRYLHFCWSRLTFVIGIVIMTLLLSAMTFLPLWAKRDNIGASTILSDPHIDLGIIIQQYFSGVKALDNPEYFPPGTAYSYFSYISPWWYILLIGVLVVWVVWLNRRLNLSAFRVQVLIGAVAIVVFCTLWGAGQNPLINLSYELIPLATQFRHVARALGLSSLWLAVIIVMAVDLVWYYLVRNPAWVEKNWVSNSEGRIVLRVGFALLIIIPTFLAAYDVNRQWHISWGSSFVRYEEEFEDYCITWLRQQYPEQELSVWTLDYKNIYTYLRNGVRHGWVASDFYHATPIAPTIYAPSLLPISDGPAQLMPEFAIGITHYDDSWMERYGYVPIPESANPYAENRPCLYRRDGAYSYIWWTTKLDLDNNLEVLPLDVTHPITSYVRDYDRIGLIMQGSTEADIVVTVQEVAYPGWSVTLNGRPVRLESVGGQIGVLLPRENLQFFVEFRYLPQTFFRGSILTLLTISFCIIYLLRIDRIFPKLTLNRKFEWGGFFSSLDPLAQNKDQDAGNQSSQVNSSNGS